MSRTPLTPHQHVEIGIVLKRVRQDLLDISVIVQSAYGKGFSRRFFQTAEMLTDLRGALETKLGKEIVGNDVEGQHIFDVYFGPVGSKSLNGVREDGTET